MLITVLGIRIVCTLLIVLRSLQLTESGTVSPAGKVSSLEISNLFFINPPPYNLCDYHDEYKEMTFLKILAFEVHLLSKIADNYHNTNSSALCRQHSHQVAYLPHGSVSEEMTETQPFLFVVFVNPF